MNRDLDIIPLPMQGGVTTADFLDLEMPLAGLTLGADPDERCEECLTRPDDFLFDCDPRVLCQGCATAAHPEEMAIVMHHLEKGD